MSQTISQIVEFINLYNNNRYLIVLFLLSLVFLWITEESKTVRNVFVYIVTALTAIFLFPLYAWIGLKIDDEIYYRVFWTLPIGILVCYSGVKLMMYFKRWICKVIIGVFIIVTIVLNGKFVYTNTLHFKAANSFHIPQVVIDVADALKMEKYKPVVVMPAELLPFIMQYSGDIITPYGRTILEKNWVEKWGNNNELYKVMEAEEYDTALIAQKAREQSCTYVVLSSIKKQIGSMEEQGYFLQKFAGGYYIYMDIHMYNVLKEQNLLDEKQMKQ